LGLRKRHLPWLACAILALIAIPALASAKGKRAAPPPSNATIVPYDFGFRDATKSKSDPTATTVTIAPGGRVDFNYPNGDGANQHNVVFGDADNPSASLPQPTACTLVSAQFPVGPTNGPPPIPAIALGPPWSGYCTFNTEGDYKFYCNVHTNMRGEVIVTSKGSNTPPTVSATRSPSGDVTSGSPVTFSATGSDADGDTISYSWDFGDGDTGTGATATHTYPPSPATYTATVTADDSHGGTSTATVDVKIVAGTPNQNPTVTAARTPTGTITSGTSVNFTATGTDPDGDTLTYAWDFGDGGSSTDKNPTHTFVGAGTYSAKVTASDGKGGTGSATLSITVAAPNQNPTVTASRTPTGSVTTGTSISFSATGSDPDGDTLTYAWDFGDSSSGTGATATHSYSTAGTYSAKVTVSDGHGGSATDTLSVTVTQANRNPTVTAARTPTGSIASGTAVDFTATGSDADGDTLSYSWDFGDSGTSPAQNPTHTYVGAGTYSAKVTVSDGKGGSGTATLSITVTAPNQNPTVSASRTPTGDTTTGTPVAFTATGSDPDGDTLTYAWDFGDSSSGTGATASHTYTNAGAYTAKVTVSDGKGGTASATLAITVTGNSTCPPGFRDDFNGTALDSSWTVVRPDATNGGVVVGGGTVSIPTGTGDIYQTANSATNIVLRTAPSGQFTMIAKINHHGNERYQQGGIILYGDDDNYVKLDRTATNASGSTNTEFFEFIQEVAGTPRNGTADHTSNIASTFPSDYYLRIVWDGTNLSGAYSTDGSAWTTVGQNSTAMPANPKLGIFALSNGAGTVVTPKFDYVTIDGPPCGTNNIPVISSATADKTNGIASLPVNFTAAATDADSDPLTYSWDFGDGATGNGATATHTYTTAGTYTAKVTVSDGKTGGTATKSITITVLAPDTPGSSFRTLIFSKTAAFRHDSIPQGITAIKNLGTQNNFQVDATEDGSLFRDDILSHYKTVIFLETTGDVLTDDQQAAFERYIRAGGGYVGIHSAADTEYAWPWYGKLVGAYFRDHPNGTPQADVLVEDTTDPSDAGLPARWTRTDEWYNFQTYNNPVNGGGTTATPYDPRDNSDLHILLKVDTSTYTGAAPTGDHPISWCHRYDGGRSWYTGMGHTQASYSEAGFLSHILAGIKITAGTLSSSACGVTGVNAAPTVTTSRTPTGNVTTGTSIAFTATGTDADGDPLTYTWDFGDSGTGTGATASHTYNTAGTYSAQVTVSDGKGGTATSTLSVVVTQPNRNPTVTASRTPTGNVATGTAIAFSAAGADADGDALTYAWDFGDSGTGSGATASHTYTTAGTYTAKVTVSDGKGGTATDSLSVTVTQANRNPTVTASRTPDGNVDPGTSIAFSAVGADADGDTLTYAWDFGDNATSNVQNPSHSYAAPGSYAAKVTVSDGKGGTANATLTVVVVGQTQGSTDTPQDVVATVDKLLALSVSPSATLGAIVPGVARDYTTDVTATVTSTAGDAALTVSDASANVPGHLVNGQYSLSSPLEARATNATQTSAAFSPIGATPVTLISYPSPVSSDAVTVGLRQSVGAGELLRAGSYGKTLTFTLKTTTP
jgi:PKD repeat protein